MADLEALRAQLSEQMGSPVGLDAPLDASGASPTTAGWGVSACGQSGLAPGSTHVALEALRAELSGVMQMGSAVGLGATSDAPAAAAAAVDEAVCSICLGPATDMASDDVWRRLQPCGHGFHASCLIEVLRHCGSRCPLCRDDGRGPAAPVEQPAAGTQAFAAPSKHPAAAPPKAATATAATATATTAAPTAAPAAPAAPQPIGAQPTRSCQGVFARHLIDQLKLHEKPPSDAFAFSTEIVRVKHCKSCPLDCRCKPHQQCLRRTCDKDGKEVHEHRGLFRPLPPIACTGVAKGYNDQCSSCDWLEKSTDKRGLWLRLKLQGPAAVSPLQQQAKKAERARQDGTLDAPPAPQKRQDLLTPSDLRTLLQREKQERREEQVSAAAEVGDANKRARFAQRHQSTAEGVVRLTIEERNQARGEAELANASAAAATVAQCSAEAEAQMSREAIQGAAEQVQQMEDTVAVERLRQKRAAAAQLEAQAAQANAERAAEAQRRAQDAELARASQELERQQRRADLECARGDRLETRCSVLAEENASLLSKLAAADEEIAQMQQRLDRSIDKGDMEEFVHSMHSLCATSKIEQKDKTLLEHLSRRLKYKRGGKHGVGGELHSRQPFRLAPAPPPRTSPSASHTAAPQTRSVWFLSPSLCILSERRPSTASCVACKICSSTSCAARTTPLWLTCSTSPASSRRPQAVIGTS